jgi:DNA-binding response OmpR family regulator
VTSPASAALRPGGGDLPYGPTVLLVEDEGSIGQLLRAYLERDGYRVVWVRSGEEALAELDRHGIRMVVLDIGLPGMDGFEVLDQLRSQGSRMPVIVLTARDSVTDTVTALDSGADDYMAKPFRFAELLARVRLRLRQAQADSGAGPGTLEAGGVHLDLRTRRATVSGREVDLSAREFTLAEIFMRHPGQVLSREQLLDHVWGLDFDPGSNVVDVYVGYLRKKFGAGAIATVRGMGYRFNP